MTHSLALSINFHNNATHMHVLIDRVRDYTISQVNKVDCRNYYFVLVCCVKRKSGRMWKLVRSFTFMWFDI